MLLQTSISADKFRRLTCGAGHFIMTNMIWKTIRPPRIGRLPYLSTAPFYFDWPLETSGFEIITAPPRQLAHLAGKGEIDAACFSLTDALRLQRHFEPLGSFGLAAAENGLPPAPLFMTRVEETLLGQTPIGIPHDAAMAPTLLAILLRNVFKIDNFKPVPLTPDRRHLGGLLLIGDAAIEAAKSPPRGFSHMRNLAALWRQWTGLPLVFGRWMVRKSLPEDQKKRLEQMIGEALEKAANHMDQVASAHLRTIPHDWELDEACRILQQYVFEWQEVHHRSADRFRRESRPSTQQVPAWLDDAALR